MSERQLAEMLRDEGWSAEQAQYIFEEYQVIPANRWLFDAAIRILEEMEDE